MGNLGMYFMIVLPFVFFLAYQLRSRKLKYNAELEQLKNRIGITTAIHLQEELPLITSISALIHKYMKQTGLPTKRAGQLLAVQTVIMLVVFVLLIVNISLSPKQQLLALVAPFVIPAFIYFKIHKRKLEFIRQFPEAIESMVRSLESGNSIDQAMKMIASDFPQPIAGEFDIMTRKITLGVPYIDVLNGFRNRVPIQEVHYLVMALIIQRETGGRLVQILDQLATLMRRRSFFQGKLKSLTAESKFTAIFIGGLPLSYIGYRYFFKRESLEFFFNDPTGWSIFKWSLALIFAGIIILKYMMRIRF
ncbi:MAG: type II secretion system F family protein [Spirochaetales bacterium]|jgi:tight adherence protein B|nr:type II secretion system F family protein [Spirochaetales bacterium]